MGGLWPKLFVFLYAYQWSGTICEATPTTLLPTPFNQIGHLEELLKEVKENQEKHVVENVQTVYYFKDKPTVPLTKDQLEGVDLKGKRVFVYTHGYQLSTVKDIKQVAAIDIKDTILQTQKNVALVVVVNWISCAVGYGLDYPDVAINVVPLVANEISKILIWMFEEKGLVPSNLELVGHSLGAQISGQVCKKFLKETGKKCSKITGLDPAGPLFKSDDRAPFRLAKEDADFVITINTDDTWGYYGDLGDHNEYPDVGFICGHYPTSFCQHGAAKDVYMLKLKGQKVSEMRRCNNPRENDKAPQLAVILVLDITQSSRYSSTDSVRDAAQTVIASLPVNSSVGVVSFGATAERNLSPILIKDENSRKTAQKSIQIWSDLGKTSTSIGAGIALAVGMMSSKEMECAEIVLISTKEENQPPYLKDVYDKIPFCSKVNSIGVGENASNELEELSWRTGGRMSFVSDGDTGWKLFKTVWDSTYAALPPWKRPIRYPVKILDVEELKVTAHEFIIDEGMAKNVDWHFIHSDISNIKFTLTSPSGKEFKQWKFDLRLWNILEGRYRTEMIAEPGTWKVKIDSVEENKSAEPIIAFITSDPIEEESIVLDTKLTSYTLDYTVPGNVSIIAQLSKGEDMIIRADVRAFITSPTNENDVFIVQLWDEGVGTDQFKDDGVYSRFISDPLPYLPNGLRYEVNVIAKGGETGRIRKKLASSNLFYRLGDEAVEGMKKTGHFEREIVAGSIRPVNSYIEPGPAEVTDLRVDYVDIAEKTVALSWTATGLQLDTGTVLSNNLTVSLTDSCSASLKSQLFPLNDQVFIADGSLQPLPAGSLQKVTVIIPESLWWDSLLKLEGTDDSFPILYFRIRAKGNEGKLSISNIASTEQYLLGLNNGVKKLVPNSLCLNIIVAIVSTLYLNTT